MDAASSTITVPESKYNPSVFSSSRFQSKSSGHSSTPWHDRSQHDASKEHTGIYPHRDSSSLIHKEDHTRGRLRLKLLWAILIFAFTLLVTHSARDHIRLCVGSARGEMKRIGPVIRRQVHVSYTHVQAFAHRHLAEQDRNPPKATYTSSVNEPAVLLSPNSSQPICPHKTPENSALNKVDEKTNAAMVRRSGGSVALRDFALNTEYIAELTSHTDTTLRRRQKLGLRTISWVIGFELGRHLGHSPNMALRDGGTDEQSCWAFPGLRGHIGIHLKERISVEGFTVDHFPRDMLSDFAILQAPRKMILWGRVDGPHNLSKEKLYRDYMDNRPTSNVFSESLFMLRANDEEHYVPLASIEYKLSGHSQPHIQTKEVPHALQSLQMDFEVVILEIISNWGASSTCLYRVRVNGSTLKAVALRTVA